MQTKLTLRLDDELINRAETWARSQGMSLSQVVASFFAQLPEPGDQDTLSAWTRSVAAIAASPEAATKTDEQLRDDYVEYLEGKYR